MIPPVEQGARTAAPSACHLAEPPTIHLSRGIDAESLHPETEAIVRQVEYYLSDENLVTDQHLLTRTGPNGTGWVSVNEILGFKKMRQYKPRAEVKASVATSKVLELQGKFIRRRTPLKIAPKVQPRFEPKSQRDHVLVEKPWLTKGMLRPTGFEEYATEGPITPTQFEEERRLFDPEDAFTTRIEYAVTRFTGRKKMHQASLAVFSKFMRFGGFETLTHMFSGGLGKKELEEYDTEEILQMNARFGVSRSVLDGLDEHSLDSGSWVVDFAGMAKAFLSSEFFQHFNWNDEKVLHDTTNVLRKFYEYLLYHDVCPEYQEDIHRAIEVCHLADEEVPQLARLESGLPGQFNIAASTLHGGLYARIRPLDEGADWVLAGDQVGLSDKDAWLAFSAGIIAHAANEQMNDIFRARKSGKNLTVIMEEDVGLEIVRVEQGTEQAAQIYGDDRISGTFIKRTGKLHCKPWHHPGSAPRDLPPGTAAGDKAKNGEPYEFLVEEDILAHCKKGMKLEANVGKLENGIMWLDLVEYAYPTFFKWTLNEQIRDWKEPGPPKAWMQRASGKTRVKENQDVVKHEIADQTPD
ncbi:hypothetical protein CERZMDRAFT_32474 [Cercospora zeae-maydis SCOH1-5]|uniref:HTH La-type RNA-binding domain-containing protein n=1 Tax=Cercospora zeae-maydis SCOH1-5 TaxID=717836 RepID=A0A6A6FUJ9_9PEZI|nr:hypothetical protein CERZMDRAFT_32474 [Cercospora zeae-maydis SCOH1-5]